MEKKITVYVVLSNNIEAIYSTKSQANNAISTLEQFGFDAELKQEKCTVKLA